MTKNIQPPPDNSVHEKPQRPERRLNTRDRRTSCDRRSQDERRFDNRLATVKQRKTIKIWLRSMIRSRLGVDRRKKRTGDSTRTAETGSNSHSAPS